MSLCAHLAGTVCFVCFRQARLHRQATDTSGQGNLPLDSELPLPPTPVPPALNQRQLAHRRVMLANFKRRQVRTS